jgi:hypothetical protein
MSGHEEGKLISQGDGIYISIVIFKVTSLTLELAESFTTPTPVTFLTFHQYPALSETLRRSISMPTPLLSFRYNSTVPV